ncbi:hypothetical protein CEXT_569821 [Caerostris extrusa]|uniref:Uncharacterized protein n=1 Tax=Caerostris extrusa TaxID=172846 RepID=A0AAV4VV24_CAEEX|nr:hypothetical protein CEXT_569821 [Caerostris extrusa]
MIILYEERMEVIFSGNDHERRGALPDREFLTCQCGQPEWALGQCESDPVAFHDEQPALALPVLSTVS